MSIADRRTAEQTARAGFPVRVDPFDLTGLAPGELLTERFRLRPLRSADREAFTALYRDGRAHFERFLPLGAAGDSPDAIFERQLELTNSGDQTGHAFRRIIADRRTGRLVGACSLISIRRGLELEADLSCWVCHNRVRGGVATEAVTALLEHSFADLPAGLGLHRIDGWIVPENISSKRLMARCGFVPVADERSHLVTGDRWQLHERWTITIARWTELRG